MAFQMIHMEIGYRLLERLPRITDAAAFVLGSVAPDAVHMNPEYDVQMKVRSHLFEGCGNWGDTQDYERWKRNISRFCESVMGKKDMPEKEDSYRYDKTYRDYGAGICVHCLTDYWNDIRIWRRLQSEYIPPMDPDEFRASYYPEARGIDRWLYRHSPHTVAVRRLLAEATATGVEGLIDKEDVQRLKNHLLHVQYETAPADVDISGYRYLSADFLEEFIECAVNDIAEAMMEMQRG